ncbi:MAG: polynucleotide adenylyltransferase [Candidatus Limnocylindrales bacterium]
MAAAVPRTVLCLSEELGAAGHAAYVVGGSLRDVLLGRPAKDWDLATDALPERILEVFAGSVYENAFGTVVVRRDGVPFEITTFRTDHDYADFRRPHRVTFGEDVVADLARRDFTVNAIAWGRAAGRQPVLVDPFHGIEDVEARILRAVGDPDARFREDALRMLRAVRLAAQLGFTVEAATLAAIRTNAGLVAHLSGERVGSELRRLLEATTPSVGLRLADETGLLAVIAPDLAAERGAAAHGIPGQDGWDHTLRTVDAVAADRPIVRLAALVHGIGAQRAVALLRRLRTPRATADVVVELVRHHEFEVDPAITDPAVRRFIVRVGRDRIDDLFALRRADDIGRGLAPEGPAVATFRARIDEQLASGAALDLAALHIDGSDLIRELGATEGPVLGRVLEGLLDRVIDEPALNERATLLRLAQGMLAAMDDEARA